MDVLFLMSIFWLCPVLKMSFEHNSVPKNLFPSACWCWDFWLFIYVRWTKKYKFGGIIGYGDSYLDFLFRHFKVFRLHGKRHDAAGAVRAHSGKRPGYCYMIGRGPNSRLLGHRIGLIFCLYLKLFLISFVHSVVIWSSMSCIVLDIELADKNVFKALGAFMDGNVQWYSVRPTKKRTNPENKRFVAQENCPELCGTVDVWITVSFQTFFLEL